MGYSKRSQARELVLKALYAVEVGETDGPDVFVKIVEAAKPGESALKFARHLFEQVRQKRTWADQIISKLAHNWKLERIAIIDRIVLRMAMTELTAMPDTPVKVVLNEAI